MNYRYYVSNWFIPRGQIALNLGPITIIKKDWFNKANAKTKTYILRHQYIHYQQWLKRPWTHHWKYWLNLEYRFDCEIEAYAHNVINDKTSKKWIVDFCYQNYANLGYDMLTKTTIKKTLERKIMKLNWGKDGS